MIVCYQHNIGNSRDVGRVSWSREKVETEEKAL